MTREAKLGRGADGRLRGVTILVVDEADALVQSREASQMHHEDRAGVDAFLAGVDDLAGAGIPLLVVLCTNRLAALDPAVLRRAAARLRVQPARRRAAPRRPRRRPRRFRARHRHDRQARPGDRRARRRQPGFTYSDLTQRLVPTAILEAYPDAPLTADHILAIAEDMTATPPFQDRPAN